MAEILSDAQITTLLMDYYKEHFGQQESDRWYPASAVNVRVFVRENRMITLHCHPFNGTVNAGIKDVP